MIEMATMDPGLLRDLTEAKADLARHGIVIVRTIETDLSPAFISKARRSMASSPKSMAKMDEDQLDDYIDRLRKSSEKSVQQLRDLYVRLLAKLAGEDMVALVKELDGIEQLIKWERISRAVQPVNEKLAEKGFGTIDLEGPEVLSEGFKVELEQKWPAAFDRFKALAREAATQIVRSEEDAVKEPTSAKTRKTGRRG